MLFSVNCKTIILSPSYHYFVLCEIMIAYCQADCKHILREDGSTCTVEPPSSLKRPGISQTSLKNPISSFAILQSKFKECLQGFPAVRQKNLPEEITAYPLLLMESGDYYYHNENILKSSPFDSVHIMNDFSIELHINFNDISIESDRLFHNLSMILYNTFFRDLKASLHIFLTFWMTKIVLFQLTISSRPAVYTSREPQ